MIALRPATLSDAAFLLALRNDPAVRALSRTSHLIDATEHQRWFATRLADPATRLYVAEHDGGAVGQGRLDRIRMDTYELSLTVVPHMRGRGFGTAIIGALLAKLAVHETAVAIVKMKNAASLRAFFANGFDGDRTVTLVRNA